MTEPKRLADLSDQEQLYISTAVLAHISAHTKERYDQARAEVASVMGPGDRKIVRSPKDGSKLGALFIKDPEPVAVVTDEKALVEWLRSHEYESQVETTMTVDVDDPRVRELLFEHGLMKESRRVKPEARREILKRSASKGEPIGPSDELDVPGISVSSRTAAPAFLRERDGLLSVYELITSGQVAIDGSFVPELEARDDS